MKYQKILISVQNSIEDVIAIDPVMERSLRFKLRCEQFMKTYEELLQDMTRRAKQKKLTEYFNKK